MIDGGCDTHTLVRHLSSGRISDESLEKQEEHKHGAHSTLRVRMSKLLGSERFDYIMGLIIMANLVVIVIETDMSTNEEEESAIDGAHWIDVFGWAVLALFLLELTARLLTQQCAFWKDKWNILDFAIVITDCVFSLIGLIGGDIFPVSLLRVFRLSKLARVAKVLRIFPELRMLLVGLVGSLRAIFWGMVLLSLFMLVWSIVAVLLIHPLNKEIDYGDCDRCSRAYSSVMQAGLTFWQQIVAGDSWGQATIPVVERYPITALFFVPVFLSVGLCVMNLMLAVIVNLAQKAYDFEAELDEAERVLSKLRQSSNVIEICKTLDKDNNGELSYDEIYAGFTEEGQFRQAMLGLGITEEDFDVAWAVIDLDNSGAVSYQELIKFLLSMKSSDTHFSLAYIKNYITWVKNSIQKQMEMQHLDAIKADSKLQQTMDKLEKSEAAIREDADMILSAVHPHPSWTSEMFQQGKGCDGTEESELESRMESWFQRHADAKQRRSASKDKVASRGEEVNDIDVLHPPCGDAMQGSNTEFISASAGHALQDLMQHVGMDLSRMHIDLKHIVRDMEIKIHQLMPPTTLRKDSL